MKTLSGGVITGGSGKNKRVENDFYATNPEALRKLQSVFPIMKAGDFVLEPCVGQGHLANIIKEHTNNSVSTIDIVNRNYPNTIVMDFFDFLPAEPYIFDSVITNPPFSLAEEFILHSFRCVKEHGTVAMFLKIQFLEGAKRKDFFDKFPPKYIYVFRKRMATFNNGNEKDENGKRWATTMCHAWFIWEKGFVGEPVIRWLD